MLAKVQGLLVCHGRAHGLRAPVTLQCGHAVCADHAVCPHCRPPPASAVLPSGVAYYPSVLAPVVPSHPPAAPSHPPVDVVLANIIDIVLHPHDAPQRLLAELTCHVCYHLLLDPVTTPCQHTFCADCLERALDRHVRCPLCRQSLAGFSYFTNHPRNAIVLTIASTVFPDLHSQRVLAAHAAARHPRFDTPIFRCSVAFPGLPLFLHIFEPRYRLMIRRCIASPRPRFGIVLHDVSSGNPSCDTPAQYGTLLEIRSVQMFPDGRSMVETIGISRFRLLEYDLLDGYQVGRVEPIDDIPPEDDADLSAIKLSPPIAPGLSGTTADLVQYCRDFLALLRTSSAPWVGQRLDNTHGKPPDDPVLFSWWIAAVLPIPERDKERLLPIRSAHARLVLITRWIADLTTSGADAGCIVT